jgi:hypothetical protein
MGDRHARRHRLHDRPEPQPERKDRGDDSNRGDGTGALCQSVRGRPRAAHRGAGIGEPRRRGIASAGCVLVRRAAGNSRMARSEGSTCRPDGRIPAKRLPRAHHRRALGAERGRSILLRLSSSRSGTCESDTASSPPFKGSPSMSTRARSSDCSDRTAQARRRRSSVSSG